MEELEINHILRKLLKRNKRLQEEEASHLMDELEHWEEETDQAAELARISPELFQEDLEDSAEHLISTSEKLDRLIEIVLRQEDEAPPEEES